VSSAPDPAAGDPYLLLLEQHLIVSMLKQARLEEHLFGAEQWSLDLTAGTLTLGERPVPADLLGLESPAQEAFFWAWGIAGVPPERRASADTVRSIGAERGIPHLTTPAVETDVMSGRMAGILASGLANADAFWSGEVEQGSVVLLVRDPDLRARPWPLPALPRILGAVAESGLPVDHRRTLSAFTSRPPHGFAATAGDDGTVTVTGPGGSVTVVFDDESGRMVQARVAFDEPPPPNAPGT